MIAVSAAIPSKPFAPHGSRLLLRLAGVADRDAADALRGSLFVIDTADLPPIDEADTYYDHQLEGLLVRTTSASNSALSPRFCTPRPANCWPSSATRRSGVAGAVRQRDRHVGVAGRRCRRHRSARWSPGPGELRARRHENRRRDDLPVLSGSVATIVAGQGNRVRVWSSSRCTTFVGGRTTCIARWTIRRTAAGPGMVMKAPVWGEALDEICSQETLLVVPTPAGRLFTQSTAQRWGSESHLVFACGRYEGIDQRVIEDAGTRMRVEEVSIGDYVLPGGESAALVMIEAVLRLLPNVLGNPVSHQDDSHSDGALEGPSLHQAAELAWTRRPRGVAVR